MEKLTTMNFWPAVSKAHSSKTKNTFPMSSVASTQITPAKSPKLKSRKFMNRQALKL